MKTFKKVAAVLLALMVALSCSVFAQAADYTTNSKFVDITSTEANTKYNNGDKFVFMFYNTSCLNCKNIGNNVVSEWMDTYGKTVYAVNTDSGFPQFIYRDLGGSVSTPVIAFVSGGSATYYQGNTSAVTLNNAFYSFYGITPAVKVSGVSLSASSVSLVSGGIKQLYATVSPSDATNKSVTWTSSNTSVATVSSSGLVTAKAAGTATVTAKTADGGYTASCTVRVSAATVSVTGVSLSPSSVSLTKGGTKQLAATVSPSDATNKAVTLTSSNTAVATVSSSGLVTAKAAGTAIITVKTNDGGYTDTCTVTVSEPATTVNASSVEIIVESDFNGTNVAQLSAKINPSDAVYKSITWTSSDPSIATVDSDGTVTSYGTAGEVVIAVTVTNNNCTTVADMITLTVEAEAGEEDGGDDSQDDTSDSFTQIIRKIASVLIGILKAILDLLQ